MPPSRRTGVSRPVVKQAPPPPSIPQSTIPRATAPAAPHAAPMAHAPQAHAPQAHAPPPAAPMHAPPPAYAPPAAAPAGGGMFSGIMGSVVTGMAMGTGSAVANRAVDSLMGPRQMEVVHKDAPAAAAPAGNIDSCKLEWTSVQECMKGAGNDPSACQFAMEMFNQCKRQNGLSA
mmetsp:Transcript_32318/g.67489  ORF Transcript_32318/g.67489 Transcript_32318/m.67489 type:complete len:175 (-) Transcript_32318:150-674(-)